MYQFHFGKLLGAGDTPSPSRSIGIIELGEDLEIIYGAQSLGGKILSPKELGPSTELLRIRFRLGYDLLVWCG